MGEHKTIAANSPRRKSKRERWDIIKTIPVPDLRRFKTHKQNEERKIQQAINAAVTLGRMQRPTRHNKRG